MPVNTDAIVYVGQFSPGDRASHELSSGRGAWVQVVDGTASIGGVTLEEGDGAGFAAPDELSFSFDEETELLLIDVRMDANRIW